MDFSIFDGFYDAKQSHFSMGIGNSGFHDYICFVGFCWYVRFNRKKRMNGDHEEYGYKQPRDRERRNVSMKNINEENIQFINNVYQLIIHR